MPGGCVPWTSQGVAGKMVDGRCTVESEHYVLGKVVPPLVQFHDVVIKNAYDDVLISERVSPGRFFYFLKKSLGAFQFPPSVKVDKRHSGIVVLLV